MKTVAQMLRKQQRRVFNSKEWEWPLPEQLMGVEIEVEYRFCELLPDSRNVPAGWAIHTDGSLREGREYVLAVPLAGNALSNAIGSFFDAAKIGRAMTSSTHIHIDMLDDVTPAALQTLVLMVYVLEPGIFQLCDPGREWTGYTNRLATAPDEFLSRMLDPELMNKDERALSLALDHNGSRYYGLNLKALAKYGSLEFRYFPTCTSAEELASWISLVQTFKAAAMKLGTMQAFVSHIQEEASYIGFIQHTFGKWAEPFLKAVPHFRAMKECERALAMHGLVQAANSGSHEYQDVYSLVHNNTWLAKFAEKNKPKGSKKSKTPAGNLIKIYRTREMGGGPQGIPSSHRLRYGYENYADMDTLAVDNRMLYSNMVDGNEGQWVCIFSRERYGASDPTVIEQWIRCRSVERLNDIIRSIALVRREMEQTSGRTGSNAYETLSQFQRKITEHVISRTEGPTEEDMRPAIEASDDSYVLNVSVTTTAVPPTPAPPTISLGRGTRRVTYNAGEWSAIEQPVEYGSEEDLPDRAPDIDPEDVLDTF